MNTGMVVMYGCAPFDNIEPYRPWLDPTNPWVPGFQPKRFEPVSEPGVVTPAITKLQPCVRCGRHIRIDEPCIFCLHDDLVALEKRVDATIAAATETITKTAVERVNAMTKPKAKKRKKKAKR